MKKLVALLLPLFLLFIPTTNYADINGASLGKRDTQVLLVVLSQKATIHATQDPKVYQLKLEGVSPHVVYFSDRPQRISGHITTKKMVDQWKSTDFHDNPPNAVMEAIGFDERTQELKKNDVRTYAIILRNPVYNKANHELTFDINELKGNKLHLPTAGMSDYVALFIDGVCLTCLGG